MIKLYAFPLSGNSQKVRIALCLLDLVFEEIRPTGGEHKRAPFTVLNPLGCLSVNNSW